MRAINLSLLLLLLGCLAINGQRIVKGKVSDGKDPIESVNVSIQDKNISTTTDANGAYEIRAETDDIVQFSYTGQKTIRIQIEDVTRILNPILVPDIQELEEVVVEASNRRSQKDLEEDYPYNDRIIRTAFQYLDADRTPGFIQFLNEDEINPVSLCILNVLRSRLAGIRVIGDCSSGGNVYLRSTGSIANSKPAAFDVDGQIFTEAPIWLSVGNIKRIAILRNFGLTLLYGSAGAGGVVVVNTVAGNPRLGGIIDYARLRNNFSDGSELTRDQLAANAPTYFKELKASNSFEQAQSIYESNASKYSGSPYFFLDAYNHFYERWNNTAYADAIIEENFGRFENNAVLLKALAYSYESQKRFEKAKNTFKEVFILRPNYSQSYFDMANAYRNTENITQAAAMYARYDYLLDEGFMQPDTVRFTPIINREFNNLLMLHKDKVVDGKQSKKLFVAEEDFKGTRLVFEWNDSEAEFELQFVNPMNQYYKWKHNLADHEATIMAEKRHGYACTEYLIDDSLPGIWKVNVNYLGNKSLTPTYLKATIYHDYGSKTQRKEIKVFKLNVKNVNQELFTLQKSNAVVIR